MRLDRTVSNVGTIAIGVAMLMHAALRQLGARRRDRRPDFRRATSTTPADHGQRITPAGLQMVVPGHVGGVGFGTGNEL